MCQPYNVESAKQAVTPKKNLDGESSEIELSSFTVAGTQSCVTVLWNTAI